MLGHVVVAHAFRDPLRDRLLAYADDIVILSSSHNSLLEAVNRHAASIGMRINASKTNMMPALIPG